MTTALASSWRCLGRWVAGERVPCSEHGEGKRADKEAAEHTAATQHTTTTSIRAER